MLWLCSSVILLCRIHLGLSSPSVIVVGAGPAGIAAATKLLTNSINNITILEAENRIGGRIYSVKFGDGIVDLGAQFCHGEKGNVAYELAKNLNILEPGLRSLQNNVYYSNGSRLDPSLMEELKQVYSGYDKLADQDFNATGKSLGELFIQKYNSTLVKKYEREEDKLKIVQEGLRFLEGYILVHKGSFSWFDPSADCDYKQCEGNQALVWKGLGYNAVLQIMMKSYPDPAKKLPIDDKIQLRAKVKKINWYQSETVTVETSENSYSADYLIFTPSIGVLKREKDSLFNPPLPPYKLQAIEATGFGGVMKIFLHFSTKWWKDGDKAFSFFWSEEDLRLIDFPDGPTKNGISWITQFRFILKVPDNPHVWVGWISGDLVPEIERLDLKTLTEGCEHVLKKFLGGKYNVSGISQMLRSTWCTNENFGGTYSYTKTGFHKKGLSYQEMLAKPLDGIEGRPRVLFAGEATNPVHYSAVHGAIETGYRAADNIIQFHKNEK